MNESDYNKHDHVHCWENKNPPCGQKIEHFKCCLCELPNPIGAYPYSLDTSDNWQERFDKRWEFHGAFQNIPSFPEIKAFIAKEKERSREEGYVARGAMESEQKVRIAEIEFKAGKAVGREEAYSADAHREDYFDGTVAGKATMLASVREKIAGMKKEETDLYDLSDDDVKRNAALQDLLNTLSTLE